MCMYKLVMSMCYRSPSVLDPQEIYVCYSHSYRGLVCFLKLQQLMLLALEVPGVIYSELSKMVSVTQMHRCPHKHVHCAFLLPSSPAQTEGYSRLWVEKQLWRKQEKLLYLLLSQVEWVCKCHSLPTLILEYFCLLAICITMMPDQEQFNIPIFLSNELSIDSLPSREGYAVKLVAQLETMLSPEPSVLLLRQLSMLVSTCSLPPGAPQSVRPRLSVVLGSTFHQSQKTLQRECRHC